MSCPASEVAHRNRRAASWTASALLGVTVLVLALATGLEARLATPSAVLVWLLRFPLAIPVAVAVGTLIVARRPRNRVG